MLAVAQFIRAERSQVHAIRPNLTLLTSRVKSLTRSQNSIFIAQCRARPRLDYAATSLFSMRGKRRGRRTGRKAFAREAHRIGQR